MVKLATKSRTHAPGGRSIFQQQRISIFPGSGFSALLPESVHPVTSYACRTWICCRTLTTVLITMCAQMARKLSMSVHVLVKLGNWFTTLSPKCVLHQRIIHANQSARKFKTLDATTLLKSSDTNLSFELLYICTCTYTGKINHKICHSFHKTLNL